jgi:Tfp pilus assembly protein PilX
MMPQIILRLKRFIANQQMVVNLLKQMNYRQEGFTMLIVLIMLLIGNLIITPTLIYMSVGIRHTTVYNRNMLEYYSAEAGFEDAYWELSKNDLEITEGSTHAIPTFILNDKAIDVSIVNVGNNTYEITSVATSNDINSSTTIESYLTRFNFFDNAINSNGDVIIQPGSIVDGSVQYVDTVDNKGTVTGQIINSGFPNWPDAQDLADDYFDDIDFDDDGSADFVYSSSSLDVISYPSFGPLYRDGNFKIKNTGSPTTSQLGGTIYVTGNLNFQQPGEDKAYTIDLNGQTIFVEGDITFPPQYVSIAGSGCIIAIGDITFQPGVEGDEDDFLFIFSIEGTVWFAPQDNFNGSVAGNMNVNLQPNDTLTNNGSLDVLGLNFPIEEYENWSIHSWNILVG